MAGSLRRRADSVKDLDIIATAKDPVALAAALAELPLVESVLSAGDAGARVITHAGMKVDLKVVEPDQFGNVLQHFTGSKAHNVALRESVVRRGLHVSEYGILDDETGETLRCATEEEVYERLGLAWIPPELREGRGELEAAVAGGSQPAAALTQEDIRGDLHCHTTLSDGRQTLEQMAEGAIARGLSTSRSPTTPPPTASATTSRPRRWRRGSRRSTRSTPSSTASSCWPGPRSTSSPTAAGLRGRAARAARLGDRLDPHLVLDGRAAMTERMIAAIEHPLVDAIGHPTGRKIETRPPYAIDMEKVIAAAARTGTMIEINAAPDRRDMNELNARAAAAAGVRVLVNTDAHSVRNFGLLPYGIATARRAWLTPEQVANTRPWAEFAPMRKRARR